jgi:hypothetical protein
VRLLVTCVGAAAAVTVATVVSYQVRTVADGAVAAAAGDAAVAATPAAAVIEAAAMRARRETAVVGVPLGDMTLLAVGRVEERRE